MYPSNLVWHVTTIKAHEKSQIKKEVKVESRGKDVLTQRHDATFPIVQLQKKLPYISNSMSPI